MQVKTRSSPRNLDLAFDSNLIPHLPQNLSTESLLEIRNIILRGFDFDTVLLVSLPNIQSSQAMADSSRIP